MIREAAEKQLVTSCLLSLYPKGLRPSLSPALLLPVSPSVLSPPKPLCGSFWSVSSYLHPVIQSRLYCQNAIKHLTTLCDNSTTGGEDLKRRRSLEWWLMALILALRMQRQVDLWEAEVRRVHTVRIKRKGKNGRFHVRRR